MKKDQWGKFLRPVKSLNEIKQIVAKKGVLYLNRNEEFETVSMDITVMGEERKEGFRRWIMREKGNLFTRRDMPGYSFDESFNKKIR